MVTAVATLFAPRVGVGSRDLNTFVPEFNLHPQMSANCLNVLAQSVDLSASRRVLRYTAVAIYVSFFTAARAQQSRRYQLVESKLRK